MSWPFRSAGSLCLISGVSLKFVKPLRIRSIQHGEIAKVLYHEGLSAATFLLCDGSALVPQTPVSQDLLILGFLNTNL